MKLAEKSMADDALVMISLRNAFYQRKFYFVFFIFLLAVIVIGFLTSVLIYLVKNPTRPLYFVTDEVSRLIQDVPKNVPNMSTNDVASWVSEAVETAFSYDFVNYRLQLQNAQKYFTDYGWQQYMKGLTQSNNLLALKQRKLVGIANVVESPKLLVEGGLGGAYAWKFEIPVLMTYLIPPFDDKSKFQNPLLVTVVVQRQSILTSYKGLGIVQMIANLAITAPSQNLNAAPPEAGPTPGG